ncbi:hypothetical protein [Nocardioides sp.]|jgi:hypothetical protein|uniref:hypothetical protein n=1 Tax=Nocardioides sp. TaxID=35761 RepID=UPI0026389464|nr:hypothetical protein [Nocardioides sp.]
MAGVSLTRSALGVLGFLVGVYGAYLLLSRQDFDQLLSAAIWLAGGVVVHDGLIALAALGLAAIGARLLPSVARTPAAAGFVVLGSITILAIPMLGRFGAKDDNATLLDRNYGLGWLGIVVLVVAAVLVASLLRARTSGETGAPDTRTDLEGDPS